MPLSGLILSESILIMKELEGKQLFNHGKVEEVGKTSHNTDLSSAWDAVQHKFDLMCKGGT